MKVFYVMVLVLVAGADTGLGRTESEGTVFNKTQLHESMNNVTVRSSKIWQNYDYLYLAMQWPGSFCIVYTCYQVSDKFTVHGLWPQHNPFDYPNQGIIDCTHQSERPFNPQLINGIQVVGLNRYWPDLKRIAAYNLYFWRDEYIKHGSCTFHSQYQFFNFTLTTVEYTIGDLALKLLHNRRGRIIPGSSYFPNAIRDAVTEVTGVIPRLYCYRGLLMEIRFCAERVLHGIQLINCRGYTNCGNRRVGFPLPPQPRP